MAYDQNSHYRAPDRSYYPQQGQEAPRSRHGQPAPEDSRYPEPQYQQRPAAPETSLRPAFTQPVHGQSTFRQPAYKRPVNQQNAFTQLVRPKHEQPRNYNTQSYGHQDGRHEFPAGVPYTHDNVDTTDHFVEDHPYGQPYQDREIRGRLPQPIPSPQQNRHQTPTNGSSQHFQSHPPRTNERQKDPRGTRQESVQESRRDLPSARGHSHDAPKARDAPAIHRGVTADTHISQDSVRQPLDNRSQLREKSAPPPKRRPLIEPPSPEVMAQDNAFPIFPTKKEAVKSKLREGTGDSSTKSRNSAGEHSRPTTAGTAEPSRRSHDSNNNLNRPYGPDAQENEARLAFPKSAQHGPYKQLHNIYSDRQNNGYNNMIGGPQMSTTSLPERTTFDRDYPPQQDPNHGYQYPSFQDSPHHHPNQSRSSNAQPMDRPRPAVQTMVTSRSLTHQQPGYLEPRKENMAAPRHGPRVIDQPAAEHVQSQSRRPAVVANPSMQPQQSWGEQQHPHESLEDFYDNYYQMGTAPRAHTASMIRDARIEAEMPDFDNTNGTSKSAHQRGLTIDRHLNDVHLTASPPPLPQTAQSFQQAPTGPAYAKPVYRNDDAEVSQADHHKRKDVPTGMAGFDFDIQGGRTPQTSQNGRYQRPADGFDPRLMRTDSSPAPAPSRSHTVDGHMSAMDSTHQTSQPRQYQAAPSSDNRPDPRLARVGSPPGPTHAAAYAVTGHGVAPPVSQPPLSSRDQLHSGPYAGHPGVSNNRGMEAMARTNVPTADLVRSNHPPQHPSQHGSQYPMPASTLGQQYAPQNTGYQSSQVQLQNRPQHGPQHFQQNPPQQVRQPPQRSVSSDHDVPQLQPREIKQHQLQLPPQLPRAKSNPDSLPHHPVPVRPGLMDPPPSQASRPPPIRQHDQWSNDGAYATSRPSMTESRTSLDDRNRSLPVTPAELAMLRTKVEKNPHDNKTALTLAKKLVEASSVLASENGRLDAKSTDKNRERYVLDAHKRIKRLVSAGYPDAMFYLADCYGQGMLGLQVDTKEAFSLYQSAAKAGHAGAAYRTAVCCEIGPDEGGGTRKDATKAVQWYRRAAQLRDEAAMYKLGVILLKGLLGQPKNITEAVVWLKKAADVADANNPHALHELALLHETGNNDPVIREKVKADDIYARELFTKAASFGYKFSQFRLGQAYEYKQLGLPMDARKSISYYSKAAAQGEHGAELALSGWYLTGAEGILEHSETEAYLWARKAAVSSENGKAMYAMGYYSENGIGCLASLEDAKRWYGRAASLRFPKAQERLEDLRKGNRAPRAKAVEGRLRRDQKRDEAECVVM